ncbi:MAG: protein-export membrane protein SecD, preprotein translocase subunit SecD [Microgenomates group bacterium GW2011_GWC1_43_13]|uniref:Protein translocase subunit SecD n=2 Tax=Candidatus Woeseibacteriota TaxID=1752722 RepID=A0A837ICT6_9BACT|nr:MAG: protein-export membrane protein SecD, preprotein translocase subunit SecD [Microgenomates group bacterium GW2011_GWC1_43_13]KKT55072.1 MAG: Preprotein translocase subunit SecD [Candidatus Woesebacteria bacterium GW2011_GWA1_44_23]OGM83214.1 MAG: protein-export membrane protein SecD [Candidatus Woesebacteria bacterium RIFOXYB1_FULL_42_36]OGM88559.1 MAG: protein-export membrane protein SecD [Candidatus Woesebacteria bacterium RIFOXYD1_FULL_43_18]
MFSLPIKKFILIVFLVLVATYISLPPKFSLFGKDVSRPNLNIKIGNFTLQRNFDLRLGLDLAGGSQLIFQADMSKVPADKQSTALNGVKGIIENRVNLFGISEPNVQTSVFEGKSRIIVELPGISDTQQAASLIGKTAQLLFEEVEEVPGVNGTTPSATLVATNLTGADLQSAQVVFDSQTGKPAISLQFTTEGGEKFAEITGRNVGKQLPIVLDNQIISAPVVEGQITGGNAQITGNFSIDEAKQLAIQLNAGALPIPVTLVQETTIGATLGATSVNQSILAGIVGVSMVGIFMILAYGRLGIVADIGLFIFAVITLALYKLIPVTLTLPGIAGFMLSIGMAVDSNILIFERFKEEKGKRSVANALEVSFGRAWDSIRDANVATIITSLVLINPFDWPFLQSSGPVRGFAITLLLGILISLFTGIFVSRNLLRVFVKGGKHD